jgi:hypothetical protein
MADRPTETIMSKAQLESLVTSGKLSLEVHNGEKQFAACALAGGYTRANFTPGSQYPNLLQKIQLYDGRTENLPDGDRPADQPHPQADLTSFGLEFGEWARDQKIDPNNLAVRTMLDDWRNANPDMNSEDVIAKFRKAQNQFRDLRDKNPFGDANQQFIEAFGGTRL